MKGEFHSNHGSRSAKHRRFFNIFSGGGRFPVAGARAWSIFLVIVLCGVSARAKGSGSPGNGTLSPSVSPLAEVVDRILGNTLLRGAAIGVQVVDLADDRLLYSRNCDSLFIPASCMKILSGGAALELLGGDFRFRTDIVHDGVMSDSIIDGNMYVIGSGDPFLVSERIWLLARELHNRGIRTVKGDLVADVSLFDGETYVEAWGKQDSRAYHARISAFSVNFNTFSFHVYPGSRSGTNPRIVPDFDIPGYVFENDATVSSSGGRDLWIERIDGPGTPQGKQSFLGTGAVRPGREPYTEYRSVSNVPYHGLEVLRNVMTDVGVRCAGDLRTGSPPDSSGTILTFESKAFPLIVRDLMKYSNNFIAEQVNRTLAAYFEGPPGSREKGLKVIRDHLVSLGMWREGYHLDDASGLSRRSRISPALLVSYLSHIAADGRYSADFESALAKGGVDGTLEKRFRGEPLRGRIHAKTGNLSGVSSISGYLYPIRGGKLVFSIMMNDISPKVGVEDVWVLQERIIGAFVEEYGADHS